MIGLILLFGALILLAGAVLVIDPGRFVALLEKHVDSLGLYVLAVVARLVLGAMLVAGADVSRYPLAIEIIGGIAIAAALFLALIGRARFRRIMVWALGLVRPAARASGFVAAGFGAFLVHAFL